MKFHCVIVTFNPDIELLTKVLVSIFENTNYLCVVDNGSSNLDEIRNIKTNFNLISFAKNRGVATAQNAGIKYALSQNADFLWLSDQDTLYPADFIVSMCSCITELKQRKVNYAVIGPCYIDALQNKKMPFISYAPFAQEITPGQGINFVSQLISSGMIIPATIFKCVGYKREDLFIDWVDFEWCWRSKQQGYSIIGFGGATIRHALGDEILSFLHRKITLRSAYRRYYIIRNGIYLSLYTNAIPIQARIEIFIKTVIWMFFYPFLPKNNKIKYFQASLLGFFHGIMAKLGAKGGGNS